VKRGYVPAGRAPRALGEVSIGELGRMLLVLGALLAAAGGVLLLAERFGLPHLPGDIVVRKGPVTFVFPLATSIVLSVVLSLVLNLLLRRH
jgi:hypothetical protein